MLGKALLIDVGSLAPIFETRVRAYAQLRAGASAPRPRKLTLALRGNDDLRGCGHELEANAARN
jgi:hypothetical protein